MQDLKKTIFLCTCLIFLAGCSSRTLYEVIEDDIDEIEQQYGFPVVCHAYYEERMSYSEHDRQQMGWELEIFWASEDPYNDTFLLIDKDGKGLFVPVKKSNVTKVHCFADKSADLYATSFLTYFGNDVKRKDLAVKLGIMKSSDPKRINVSNMKIGF